MVSDMGWRVDDEVQQMLRDNARAWLAEIGGVGRVRQVRASTDGFDKGIWAQMGALGWTGILLPEAAGGSDLGLAPSLTLAEEMGRAAAPEPYIVSAIMAATLLSASSTDEAAALAAALAKGERSVTLAWQEQRGELGLPSFATRISGNKLSGTKVHVPGWHSGTALLVAAAAEDGPIVALVDIGAPGVNITTRQLADSSYCADIVLDNVAVGEGSILLSGDAAQKSLSLASARGTVAISAQMDGLATALWQMTNDYLRQRSQFGSPLSSFQALRHRMVDLYAEIELAAASWRAAAIAVEAGDLSSKDIHSAKARCSQIAQDMGRWAIQYHGAFGYMEEADVGLYVHAGLCWSSWLGNPTTHRRAALMAHRAGR